MNGKQGNEIVKSALNVALLATTSFFTISFFYKQR
ncbi:hypothetical protein PRO82_000914 [Candidatus Protochlamydia amoebophila]|nr:hypothetical protein [Candidatus Protochlamydia amoebophila]